MDVGCFAPQVQLVCATIPCSMKAFGEHFFFLCQLTLVHIINLALRLKLQIWHRKSKYNSHCGVQKYSAQGHPFSSWVLSAGDLSVRAGTNPPLSCETSQYGRKKKKLPAFLAARWYLQTLCSWTSLPGWCFCFAPFSGPLWTCWWTAWQAWPGSLCALSLP